jgi:hypothetical protein
MVIDVSPAIGPYAVWTETNMSLRPVGSGMSDVREAAQWAGGENGGARQALAPKVAPHCPMAVRRGQTATKPDSLAVLALRFQ